MPDSGTISDEALIEILGRTPETWMTLAQVLQYCPDVEPDNCRSHLTRMMDKGKVLRKENVGPRGGYGYQLSNQTKTTLKKPVSRYKHMLEDPFGVSNAR